MLGKSSAVTILWGSWEGGSKDWRELSEVSSLKQGSPYRPKGSWDVRSGIQDNRVAKCGLGLL